MPATSPLSAAAATPQHSQPLTWATLWRDAAFWGTALVALHLIALNNYVLFHTASEGFSIVVAAAVFLLVWDGRRLLESGYLLIIGIGYLFVSIIDAVHTLAFPGVGVISTGGADLSPQFWLVARGLQAATLLVAPLFLRRTVHAGVAMAAFSAVTTVLIWLVFAGALPASYVEGSGVTLFKALAELGICGVLVAAGALLYDRRRHLDPDVVWLVLASIAAIVGAEVFSALYVDMFGISNMLCHLLKLVSLLLIYKAIVETGLVRPWALLYRNLGLARDVLEQAVVSRTMELDRSNRLLRAIRNISRNITTVKGRDQLVQACCSSLVETRGYTHAWIAAFDREECLLAVGAAGLERLVQDLRTALAQGPLPSCVRQAIDTGGMVWVDGRNRACPDCPLSAACGSGTVLTLPLMHDERSYGVLSVVRPAGVGEETEERALLAEVGADIGIALHSAALEDGRLAARLRQERLGLELRQAQKMEALGVLAGGIAHDFNNVLGAIVGYTDLTLRALPEGSRERKNLGHVMAAANRATDLVRQILTFSRRTEAQQQPLDVVPIVKEALKLLRASLPSTISIEQRVAATPGRIMGDATQVHQVLMNLCTNAAYAMQGRNGVLSVIVETVDLAVEDVAALPGLQVGRHLRLTVRDTGHGIDEKAREHIFEPFYTTKPPGEGTGLGLPVVHGIVRSHHGHICFESTPGTGTAFFVHFPSVQGEARVSVAPSAELPRREGRVLLVDDERVLAELAAEMLSSLGYTVNAHASSEEALAAFAARPSGFDVLVTDNTMPGMDGVQLAAACHALRPDLPVVLCTGHSVSALPADPHEVGIERVLIKPYTQASLAEAVWRVLEKRAGR